MISQESVRNCTDSDGQEGNPPYEDYIEAGTGQELPEQIAAYCREIATLPMLEPEEERELAKQISEGGEQGKKAEQRMILANLRLVVYVAKQFDSKSVEMMDLIQYGNMGLMTAVKKFDYRKGFRFSTYAVHWIRQSISRNLTNLESTVRIPAHRAADLARIRKVRNELRLEYKREPTDREIAEKLNISPEALEEAFSFQQHFISTDAVVNSEEDGRTSLSEFITDTRAVDPEEAAIETARTDTIMAVLDEFPPKEKDVLIRRLGLQGKCPEILEKIASDYGMTREGVRQIERKAMDRLRRPKYKKRLRDFAYS